MKYLLLATLIAVCFAGSLTASENGKTINFKHDIHPESLVGFTFEGNIDPMNHLNNKITTFLKIVKTYIPILKTIGQKEQGLSFRRVYRVNFPGLDVIIDIYFQLLIGWRVENASSQTSFFNVTYVPFIQGWMNGLFNGTAAPGVGWYTVDLQFLNSYVSIFRILILFIQHINPFKTERYSF